MAVKILNDKQKEQIFIDWEKDTPLKVDLALRYGVSTRTINRVLDEIDERRETDDDLFARIDRAVNTNDDLGSGGSSPKEEYSFVASKHMISIIRLSDGKGISITKDNENFEDAYTIIKEENGSQESLEIVFEDHNVESKWEVYKDQGVNVDVEQGRVYYEKGNIFVEFHGRLVSRLIEALKSDDFDDLYNMVDFAVNLLENPDERSINGLYDFLEASDIKIVEGGMVQCWKKVREDYKDVYTGTIDNSPDTLVTVPRHKVNPDPDVTCSYGLHVCSESYLSHYPGERVIRVSVHPKDFVAIPSDYNFAKARVCSYYVEEDVTEEMLK